MDYGLSDYTLISKLGPYIEASSVMDYGRRKVVCKFKVLSF